MCLFVMFCIFDLCLIIVMLGKMMILLFFCYYVNMQIGFTGDALVVGS